jgi:hypothetical protein
MAGRQPHDPQRPEVRRTEARATAKATIRTKVFMDKEERLRFFCFVTI